MSTQMREDEHPMPDRLYVSTSRRILKWLTSMAAMLGVGAKQLHDTITMSTCARGVSRPSRMRSRRVAAQRSRRAASTHALCTSLHFLLHGVLLARLIRTPAGSKPAYDAKGGMHQPRLCNVAQRRVPAT